jgi:hypothetical protein
VENQKKVKEMNCSAASSGEHNPKGFNKKKGGIAPALGMRQRIKR